MPQSKYVPQHRGAPARPTLPLSGPVVRGALLGGLALATTGATVGAGTLAADPVVSTPGTTGDPVDVALAAQEESLAGGGSGGGAGSDERADRSAQASRSERRRSADTGKAAALGTGQGGAVSATEDLSSADPRTLGRALLGEYGFSDDQFSCLDALYVSESDWRVDADNPTSSAYGIPQALTGLHDVPEGYFTSAEVQIRWGLDYIRDNYGTPCSAWSFKQGNGWY